MNQIEKENIGLCMWKTIRSPCIEWRSEERAEIILGMGKLDELQAPLAYISTYRKLYLEAI